MVSIGNAIISGADIISKSINSGTEKVSDNTDTIIRTFVATILGSVITWVGVMLQQRFQRIQQLKDKLTDEYYQNSYCVVIKDKVRYNCRINKVTRTVEQVRMETIDDIIGGNKGRKVIETESHRECKIGDTNIPIKRDSKFDILSYLYKEGYKVDSLSIK